MAANGHNTPSQLQAVNDVVGEDSAKHRVPVHQFNPDSTPQQKAAAAGAGKEQLKRNAPDAAVSGKGAQQWLRTRYT